MAQLLLHWIPLLFLFCGCFQLVTSQNCSDYDISPTCFTQSCLTLSDLVATGNFSEFSCLHLNLLPGEHNLTVSASIDNIQSFSVTGNSTTDNVTVTCNELENSTSFRFENVNEVYVRGLTFMNCDMHIASVELFTVETCTFTGDDSDDAALIFVNTTTDISFSVFSNLQGFTFGPYADTSGAIICSNSIITISHSIMDGNVGQKGGAIFADRGCSLIAMNCTFTNNRAEQGGVMMVSASFSSLNESNDYGISFSDCIFSGNSADNGGVLYMELQILDIQRSNFSHSEGVNGGIFYLNESEVTIHESWFTYNAAQRAGGVIFAHNSDVYIDNSNFTNNIASNGGVLYTATNTNTDIQQSYFANNAAEYDGGVTFSINNSSTGIYNCSFERNVAVYDGGVLYGRHNQTTNVHGSYFSNNLAGSSGGVLNYASRASTYIHDSSFTNNVAHFDSGALFATNEVHTSIHNCVFVNNSAGFDGGVYVGFNHQTLNIYASQFLNNTSVRSGGAIFTGYDASTSIYDSYFVNNRADYAGGAIIAVRRGHTRVYDSYFANNTADFAGGAFSSYYSQTAHIYNSSFLYNRAEICGGAVDGSFNVSMEIQDSNLTHNTARDGGAVYALRTSTSIDNCIVSNNIALDAGGAMSAILAPTDIHNSVFESNSAYYAGGALNVYYNEIILINGSLFRNNSAKNRGGVIHCAYNTSTDIYDSIFTDNSSPSGGAIFAFDYAYKGIYESNQFVNFSGKTILENNRATKNGGALITVESTIYINDELIVTNNSALHSGGGIYLHSSQMGIRGNCTLAGNTAERNGGGLFSISSSIALQGNEIAGTGGLVTFTENAATHGGGLFLVLNSKLYVVFLMQVSNTFSFIENNASFGGGIFVVDEANQETCIGDIYSPIPTSSRGCFFQTIELLQDSTDSVDGAILKQSFNFTNNEAEYAGDDLFGGLLDRCTVRYVQRSQQNEDGSLNAGLALLSDMSNVNLDDNQTVSSHAIKVHLCLNDEPDYRYDEPIIQVERGESFTISVVAVDQVNHPLKAIVKASLFSTFSGFSEGQHSQEVNAACTNLTFTVTAPDTVVDDIISLHADGPCGDAKRFERQIIIEFKECKCPVGFQRDEAVPNSCTCICHRNITRLVESCNSTTALFVRKQNSWISYINSATNSENVSTYYLLGHQHCPYDYCYTSSQDKEDEINEMCALNRAGILCGKCQSGFSVSLGSSKCLKCTNSWPALLILMLSIALIAGAALVFFILFLNITVAVGTISGIIFYANIIAANSSVLVRLSSPSFPSVFISWLNLDIGFDICFYDGMDTYAKTWLQMAFPTYLIILIVVVIVSSKYSQRFSKLIGKRNPIATLATLILLSYTTLLSALLNTMSSTELMYPDGPRTLWLPDANINFLKDPKHIFLFLVGVLIIIVGAAYTLLLFSWQWLLQLPDWKIFSWTRFPRLNSFMETYHIPYNYKYRFWTGLLLFVRVVVYLVSALNRSGDPKVPLLATILVIGVLIFLDRNRCNGSYVGLLESSIYLNILVLATFSWYTIDSTGAKQLHIAAVYISTLIVFAQLILVIVYHSYRYTKLQSLFESTQLYISLQRLGLRKEQPKQKRDSLTSAELHHVNRDIDMFEMIDYVPVNHDRDSEPRTESSTVSTPTVTIIDITKERQEKPPNPCAIQKQQVGSESACSSNEQR